MVVITGDGLKEYRAYQKIPYYQWKFRDENGVVYTNPKEDKFPKQEDVIADKYHSSDVVVDSTEEKHQIPPRLPDLATISATLAARGVRAREVLDVYQRMYEDQIVSYPRTEDKVITPEQFRELLPLANRIAAVVGVDSGLLTHRGPRGSHVKTGGAHGANRPGTNVPASLDALKAYGKCAPDIYEMLAKAYLAMLCEDYIYTQQKGHIKDYPDFKGVANKPVSMGYRLVYNEEEEDSEEPRTLLGKSGDPFIFEGFPPKPPLPTVKWLMKQLEKRDVGTGATRTSTYAEVSSARSESSLLKETRGKLDLTQAGEVSYCILPGTHIGSLEMTEAVYQQMKSIAEGKETSDSLLPNIEQLVREDIVTMQNNMPKVMEQFPDLGKYEKKEKTTDIYEPTGEEVSFSKEWGGHTFTEEEISLLLKGEQISFESVSKSGKPYTAQGKLEKQRFKGKTFWGFKAEFPSIPDTWSGYTFTEEEKAALEEGKEIEITAISAKKKKEFRCKLILKKTKAGNKLVPTFL